ncbi:MAG: copper resistance protein CopC [Roseobacter sp.]
MKSKIIALAALLTLATNALGHSKATQTTPDNNAMVQAIDIIEMQFDDPMRVTAISLTGPSGNVEIIRETGLEPVSEFRARPNETLGAGVYHVDWRGLASDGHPMQGTFSFTIAE